MNLRAFNRWASSTLGGAGSEVIITGGTVNSFSSQLAGISCKSDGSIKILGGNVLAKGANHRIAKCIDSRYNIEQTNATDGTNQLYLTPIKISSPNQKVEELNLSDGINYGIKDMYTLENDNDENGIIYLYLPLGNRTITIKVNGKVYSGTIQTTTEENINILE